MRPWTVNYTQGTGGYPSSSRPTSELKPPPENVTVRKEEPVTSYGYDLSDDCFCKNNDPECKECWDVARVRAFGHGYVAPTPPPVTEDERFRFDVTTRFQECEALLLRKHKDYGPSNIGNAPGGPLNGLRVRMHDKLARINHLIDSGADPANESLRDSFADLVNYGIISMLFLDSAWPKGSGE